MYRYKPGTNQKPDSCTTGHDSRCRISSPQFADVSRVNTPHAKLSQSEMRAVTGLGASLNSVRNRQALTAVALATRMLGCSAPRAKQYRAGRQLGR